MSAADHELYEEVAGARELERRATIPPSDLASGPPPPLPARGAAGKPSLPSSGDNAPPPPIPRRKPGSGPVAAVQEAAPPAPEPAATPAAKAPPVGKPGNLAAPVAARRPTKTFKDGIRPEAREAMKKKAQEQQQGGEEQHPRQADEQAKGEGSHKPPATVHEEEEEGPGEGPGEASSPPPPPTPPRPVLQLADAPDASSSTDTDAAPGETPASTTDDEPLPALPAKPASLLVLAGGPSGETTVDEADAAPAQPAPLPPKPRHLQAAAATGPAASADSSSAAEPRSQPPRPPKRVPNAGAPPLHHLGPKPADLPPKPAELPPNAPSPAEGAPPPRAALPPKPATAAPPAPVPKREVRPPPAPARTSAARLSTATMDDGGNSSEDEINYEVLSGDEEPQDELYEQPVEGAQQLYYESKGRASNLGTSGAVLDEDLYEVATDELSGGGRSSSSGGRPRSVQSSGGDGAHGAPPVLPPPGTKPGDYGSFKPVGLPPPAPARAPNTKLVGDAGGAPPRPPTRSPEGTSSDSSTSRLDPNTRPREALPPPPTPGAGVAEHPSAGGSTGSASGSRPVSGISSSSADGPSSIPKLGAGSAIPSKVNWSSNNIYELEQDMYEDVDSGGEDDKARASQTEKEVKPPTPEPYKPRHGDELYEDVHDADSSTAPPESPAQSTAPTSPTATSSAPPTPTTPSTAPAGGKGKEKKEKKEKKDKGSRFSIFGGRSKAKAKSRESVIIDPVEQDIIASMAVDAPALAEASSPMPVKPRTTTELELHIGDKLDILKMEGCPTGKWLARKSDGLIGFVRCNEVAMDPASLKMVMSKVTPPSKIYASPEGVPLSQRGATISIEQKKEGAEKGSSGAKADGTGAEAGAEEAAPKHDGKGASPKKGTSGSTSSTGGRRKPKTQGSLLKHNKPKQPPPVPPPFAASSPKSGAGAPTPVAAADGGGGGGESAAGPGLQGPPAALPPKPPHLAGGGDVDAPNKSTGGSGPASSTTPPSALLEDIGEEPGADELYEVLDDANTPATAGKQAPLSPPAPAAGGGDGFQEELYEDMDGEGALPTLPADGSAVGNDELYMAMDDANVPGKPRTAGSAPPPPVPARSASSDSHGYGEENLDELYEDMSDANTPAAAAGNAALPPLPVRGAGGGVPPRPSPSVSSHTSSYGFVRSGSDERGGGGGGGIIAEEMYEEMYGEEDEEPGLYEDLEDANVPQGPQIPPRAGSGGTASGSTSTPARPPPPPAATRSSQLLGDEPGPDELYEVMDNEDENAFQAYDAVEEDIDGLYEDLGDSANVPEGTAGSSSSSPGGEGRGGGGGGGVGSGGDGDGDAGVTEDDLYEVVPDGATTSPPPAPEQRPPSVVAVDATGSGAGGGYGHVLPQGRPTARNPYDNSKLKNQAVEPAGAAADVGEEPDEDEVYEYNNQPAAQYNADAEEPGMELYESPDACLAREGPRAQ